MFFNIQQTFNKFKTRKKKVSTNKLENCKEFHDAEKFLLASYFREGSRKDAQLE